MADIKSAEARSRNMSAIRSKNTKIELYVRKELFKRGYRYRIAPSYISGHPDLYLRKYRLAIFIHGCFWHRHEGCKYAYVPKSRVDFWTHKFQSNVRRDREVVQMLMDKEIRVLIIWECAIKQASKKNNSSLSLFEQMEKMIHSDELYCEVGGYAPV